MAAVALTFKPLELEDLLNYKNEDVVESFTASFAIERDEADDIFREMLKFLWLSHHSNDPLLRVIDAPISIIDEMWHIFILFTKEYNDFSYRYFGRFMHHSPVTEAQRRKEQSEWSESKRVALLEEKRQRYHLVYDQLGRSTFIKWFHKYPSLYSKERIRELRRK